MKFVRDPLLAAANVLLIFFIAMLSLGATMLLAGAPAALIFKDRLVTEFAANGASDAADLFPEISFVLVALAALVALGVYFLVLLRRIVRSVGEGDPFAPVNAARLLRMGWLVVIGQVATIPIGFAVVRLAGIVGEARDQAELREEFGFDATVLLLALILFILARVFRRGAEMREELEGTV